MQSHLHPPSPSPPIAFTEIDICCFLWARVYCDPALEEFLVLSVWVFVMWFTWNNTAINHLHEPGRPILPDPSWPPNRRLWTGLLAPENSQRRGATARASLSAPWGQSVSVPPARSGVVCRPRDGISQGTVLVPYFTHKHSLNYVLFWNLF